MQRIGLFGGSFDPVHCGHLLLAERALREYALDTVLFVPAKTPPHKTHKTLTPAFHRLTMLRLALKPYPFFRISRFELGRKRATYTYQTLRHFRARYPRAQLFFLIGADSLMELKTWKKPDLLLTIVEFIVGKRKGVRISGRFGPAVHFVSGTIPAVSSTTVREEARSGRSIAGLVPEKVGRYIRSRGLYAPPAGQRL